MRSIFKFATLAICVYLSACTAPRQMHDPGPWTEPLYNQFQNLLLHAGLSLNDLSSWRDPAERNRLCAKAEPGIERWRAGREMHAYGSLYHMWRVDCREYLDANPNKNSAPIVRASLGRGFS